MALIALGVTGGIGAYKAVEVVRGLQKPGHDVTVVMTRSARRFVASSPSRPSRGGAVVGSQWTPGLNADIEHIALATALRSAAGRAGDGQHHRASSPTASPTTSCRRCTWRPPRRCCSRRR